MASRKAHFPKNPSSLSEAEILAEVTARLSRVARPNVKTILDRLKAGYIGAIGGKYKGHKYAMSSAKHLEFVVKAIRAGVQPNEIPREVRDRFNWLAIRDLVRAYSEKRGADPDAVEQALFGRRRPTSRTRIAVKTARRMASVSGDDDR